jgi:hypothetical protein
VALRRVSAADEVAQSRDRVVILSRYLKGGVPRFGDAFPGRARFAND